MAALRTNRIYDDGQPGGWLTNDRGVVEAAVITDPIVTQAPDVISPLIFSDPVGENTGGVTYTPSLQVNVSPSTPGNASSAPYVAPLVQYLNAIFTAPTPVAAQVFNSDPVGIQQPDWIGTIVLSDPIGIQRPDVVGPVFNSDTNLPLAVYNAPGASVSRPVSPSSGGSMVRATSGVNGSYSPDDAGDDQGGGGFQLSPVVIVVLLVATLAVFGAAT